MLRLYLQDYDSGQLERLKQLCLRCLYQKDWEARVERDAATPEEITASIRDNAVPALFMLENSGQGRLNAAVREIRRQNPANYLVLLLGAIEEALEPRAPYYRASGLMLKPVGEAALDRLLEEVYDDFARSTDAGSELFRVKVKGLVYPITYRKVLFFESTGKKIVARTTGNEYSFYGSLEKISEEAPRYFQRIHKSYCVNLNLVEQVNYGSMTVKMGDGSEVQVSRSYKSILKDSMNALGAGMGEG